MSANEGGAGDTVPISIRPARPSDAGSIFQITEESFIGLAGHCYTQEQRAGWMNGVRSDFYLPGIVAGSTYVAERDATVVGYVDAVPGELVCLFVLPVVAGRGLGARLLECGLRLARQGHSGPIGVEALLNAVPFYERAGFVQIRPGFSSHGTDETPPIEIMHMELRQASEEGSGA